MAIKLPANHVLMAPRWAFERVEQERCAARGLQPNPANIDVVMANPTGWPDLHAWAAYIARVEAEQGTAP